MRAFYGARCHVPWGFVFVMMPWSFILIYCFRLLTAEDRIGIPGPNSGGHVVDAKPFYPATMSGARII